MTTPQKITNLQATQLEDACIRAIHAFCRLTPMGLHIYNDIAREFATVKDCEYLSTEEQYNTASCLDDFWRSNCAYFETRFQAISNFFKDIKVEDKHNFVVRINICLQPDENSGLYKNRMLVNATPLQLGENGDVLLWLLSTAVPTSNVDGMSIENPLKKEKWLWLKDGNSWKSVEFVHLTKLERKVVSCAAMGYSMEQTAKAIYRSVNTAKKIRVNLIAKLGLNNITDVVNYVAANDVQ